ncbi:MAG: N-acetylmuramoyl-L-alanine amidase [Alphaproteobacteria bacterium]|nr:N-acetylmuramoyl-L-alanine amidase [Alphaproteobacteria bacterium]
MGRPHRVGHLLLAAALLLVAAVGGIGVGPARAEPAEVLDVRLGTHGSRTRFVLDLTGAPPFDLTAESDARRLVLDLQETRWPIDPGPVAGLGLIAGYYLARTDETGDVDSRVVLDLRAPVRVEDIFFIPATEGLPYRFVIDLRPAPAAPTPASAPLPARVPDRGSPAVAAADEGEAVETASAALPLPAVPLPGRRPAVPVRPVPGPERPLIVLDAGHGGVDPGAIGASGVLEKTVTLQMARRLRDRLTATGRFAVVLTRDGDEYLRLRERVEVARRAGADLFLSLHADSNPDPNLSGASVYTLSDHATDREAAQLAQRENRVDALIGVHMDPEDDVMASILIDLAQRRTRGESNLMAELLVDRLGERVSLLNNTHRHAGFAVLTAPDVPSVLVELGHLSNAEDERLLVTADYQEQLAAALAEAVSAFFSRATARRGL